MIAQELNNEELSLKDFIKETMKIIANNVSDINLISKDRIIKGYEEGLTVSVIASIEIEKAKNRR